MGMSDAERARRYRARKGAEPRKAPPPCPSVAAARRHQRNGEELCEDCKPVWREYNLQAQRKSRGIAS